jgi:ribosomal protein S18 acetylase RimI-like enzyme
LSALGLEHAIATERRLLEPIADLTDNGDHLVYRSDRFPTFYAANGIEIRAPRNGGLAAWERLFDESFGRSTFEHRTFTFKREPELEPLAREAREQGYHVVFLSYLIATRGLDPGTPPDGLSLAVVESEEDWDRMRVWDDLMARGNPWYQGPASSDRLFERVRYVSERIGITWLTLLHGNGRIASKLGLFRHGPVYRLQDVATDPAFRRRGLSSYLLRVALERALSDADGLVVQADVDYHAIDLYRKLGFDDVGQTVEMMLYPPQQP